MLSLGLEVSSEMSLGLPLSALSSHWLAPAALPALRAMSRVGDGTGSPQFCAEGSWVKERYHILAECPVVLPVAYQMR